MGKRVRKAERTLSRSLLKSIDVELDYSEGDVWIGCSGGAGFFEHGSVHYLYDEEYFFDRPRLLARLQREGTLRASKALTRELAIHKSIVQGALHSAAYQMAVSELTGAHFLAHRAVDVDVLQRIAADECMTETNSIIARNWNNMVPFVGDISLPDLVKLRSRERQAFAQYRMALEEAVGAVVEEGESLSDKIAKNVYADILRPELAKLDIKVKEAKKDLIRAPIASTVGISAAIGVGLYAGLLPTELQVVAGALGLSKVSYDIGRNIVLSSDVSKTIRSERFYFLWKISHAASYRGHR